MTDDELLALARNIALNKWCGRFVGLAESKELEADIIALIERHRAEVERLTRERDADGASMYLKEKGCAHADARIRALESALAAAQKRVGELSVAGDNLNALITRTQERLTAWLAPDSAHDERECMNELLEMFDGPRQREVQSAWRKTTGAK